MLARSGSSPLPPVVVSPQQKHAFAQLTTAVVDHTVSGFIALSRADPRGDHQRRVDPSKWKAFKKHETVQIYRSRDRVHDGSPVGPGIDWEPMVKLLCVGTMLGGVDDAMYGAVTPTELAMATRSLYIRDEFTEHRVLHDFDEPTHDEPFQYRGIKWGARSTSIAALIKPRETLYLEATGCRNVRLHHDDSERIGFVVYHSVELPEMPKADGMVRARISACYIFRQAAAGVVELYGTMSSDAGGNLPTKLAALAGATVMISVSRVTECALKKKLAWMLSSRSRKYSHREDARERSASTSSCVQCSRNLSSFSSLTECAICQVCVCSRCTTSRQLLLGRTKATLRVKAVTMCKSCISTAKYGNNTSEIAAAEFTRRVDARATLPSSTPPLGASSSHHCPESSRPLSVRSDATTQSVCDDHVAPMAQLFKQEESMKIREVDIGDEYAENVAFSVEDQSHAMPARAAASQQAPPPNEGAELWNRINALRRQAEETYQLAKEQTVFMQQSAASRMVSE